MKQLILASTSPRRKEILEKTGLKFKVVASRYEEDMSLPMSATNLPQFLAEEKAKEVAKRYPEAVVIGADTIVAFGGKVLGKPKSKLEARKMLKLMSGKVAKVITGFSIIHYKSGRILTDKSVGSVYFKSLSDKEIDAYIRTGEPMGRAGAFAVQEQGAALIEKVTGDFMGVVGLSQYALLKALKKFGVKVF
jgi:septum formation protein